MVPDSTSRALQRETHLRPEPEATVFIGTSPLVLCHALDQALRGEPIRILEERREIGGAWRTFDAFGCVGVEAAVHLIENRSAVHRTLSQLGVPLIPPTGRTGASLAGVEIPLPLSRSLAYLGVFGKSALRGEFGRARTAFIGLGRAVGEYRTPFLYPPRGARQITDRLLQLLAARDVRPECGIRVRQARRIGRDACLVETEHGAFTARRIAIASRAHCTLCREDRTLDLSIRTSTLECLAVRIAGPAPKFDYFEFHGRSPLRRVRNLTRMLLPPLGADEHVISVQMRTPARESPPPHDVGDAPAAAALTVLKDAGLLAPTARLIESRRVRFDVRTIPDQRMRQLARDEADWVLPIRTTDFGEELASALRRLHLESNAAARSARETTQPVLRAKDGDGARGDECGESCGELHAGSPTASPAQVPR